MMMMSGSKTWGVAVAVAVVLGWWLVVAPPPGASAQQGTYACWGGCYNQCVLEYGLNPTQRVPCYLGCLGRCATSFPSDLEYYCQIGCSLQQCIRYSYDGANMERCLENCAGNICGLNA
ncbi:protein TAP1-like [Diospyros lotus]|uniref:protein TAP1-like n=1 Tax=Diospyros lotus TaxID=55363 RepID=UPI0022537154|nr:protein TAP1-like [Diospyros lotus]